MGAGSVQALTQDEIFKQASSLRRQKRRDEALNVLRDGLRREIIDSEGIDKAGRMIRTELQSGEVSGQPLKVLILGQCTTSWLVNALTASGWCRNQLLHVSEGQYDNVLQELNAISRDNSPDIIILLPWHNRLFGGSGSSEEKVAEELAFWKHAWELIRDRSRAKLIQVGYDWIVAGPLGQHLAAKNDGPINLVRKTNAALRENLPEGAYFVDLEQVSGEVGRASFYDPRRYYWTKQPFSEKGTCHLGEAFAIGIQALRTGPKKVLVLDLDNTLWGGVVGETGPLGVTLDDTPEGEAYKAFQKYAKALSQRGILLAVASKNNSADAREPFEKNPDMVLRLDDIAAFEASWEPKETTIVRMAKTLNLGLDSFVFFDDNPAERELIRQSLPEVEVIEVPRDPAEYVRALQAGNWFESTGLTEEDRIRAEQYAVERSRRELQETAGSMDDYLRSLQMIADLREVEEADLTRVVQLLSKTNQFNLTTRRHSLEDVVRMCDMPGAINYSLRMHDRFGDHGLIAVLLAVPHGDEADGCLRIDTWLMSCRVISRTVEQFLFKCLLERSQALGHRKIIAEYIPTKKNALVANLLDDLGFTRVEVQSNGTVLYELDVSLAEAPKTFISAAEARVLQ